MPVINIREIDNTTAGLAQLDQYIVFIPGNVGSDFKSDLTKLNKPLLFTSLADFTEAFGKVPYSYELEQDTSIGKPFQFNGKIIDPGYLQATLLLSRGMQVLYKVPALLTDGEHTVVSTNEDSVEIKQGDTEILDALIESPTSATINHTLSEDLEDGALTSTVEYITYSDIIAYTGDKTSSVNNLTSDEFESFKENGRFTRDDVIYSIIKATASTSIEVVPHTQATISSYSDFVEAINKNLFYEDLKDKSLYNIRFITNGGYDSVDVAIVDNKPKPEPSSLSTIQSIAEQRGDCVALVDHRWNLEKALVIESANRVTNNAYSAMFSPWCSYNVNDYNIVLPASVAYLEAFASAVVNNPTWYAAAGALRGTISGVPIKDYGETYANTMSRDIGVSVNPITPIAPYGVLIWGNRTLFDNPKGLVASSFLNIRQLCCDLKKQLYVSAKGYMFEQNSDRVWFNFKSQIARLLDNMQTGQGIRGYKIIKLTPDSKAQIKALVRIIPIEAVEKFDLTVELSDTLEVTEG